MPARMPLYTSNRGIKTGLISGAFSLIFWLVLVILVSLLSGSPISESYGTASRVFVGITFGGLLSAWTYARGVSGQVLLDCGPIPGKNQFLFPAVGSLVFGLVGLAIALEESGMMSFSAHVYRISPCWDFPIAMFFLALNGAIMASGRLQMREAGVWPYCGLLRWNKIGAYHWVDDSTLLLDAKGVLPLLFHCAVRIPPEHKVAVEQLLQEHCPEAAWELSLADKANARDMVRYLNDE